MASSNVSLIIPLAQAQPGRRAGKKAINLSRLIAAHFVVPRGFVISADAYRSQLWASGAREAASNAIEAEDREKIREAIITADIPEDVWSSVSEAYQRLSLQLGFENPFVVVRPSAIEDGLAETSFSGAYESILKVSGQEALKMAIKRVWASLWSGKAAAYRMRYGITAEPAMAVIIQQMMDGQWWGTSLTADPVTGNRNRVIVSCSSSASATDLSCHMVDLHAPSIITGGDNAEGSPGASLITLLAEKAIVVENTLGCSVEVEWTYDLDRLWILQASPIADIPPYFPCDEETEPGIVWKRLSSKPISFVMRPQLRDVERLRIINGYAYEITQTSEPAHAGKEMAEGFKLLEEWGNSTRKPQENHLALPAERDELVGHTEQLYNEVKNLLAWMSKARHFGGRFTQRLRETIDTSENSSTYNTLLCGLPGRVIMRDARLQELADQFRAAEKTGRIDDQNWRRSYKAEVESFSNDYGYSFLNLSQTLDPSTWESWVENSDLVFRKIAAINCCDSHASLITLHCAAEDAFNQKSSEIEKTVSSAKKANFEKTLRLSRGWLALGNECEIELGLVLSKFRNAMIELGNSLLDSKTIANRDDIFNLALNEISDIEASEIATLVAQRKHDIWLEQRLTAPDFLPIDAALITAQQNEVNGISICSGTVTGRIRKARSIEEAGEIENGEILIVDCATLAWTPFLAVAGGFISKDHCSQPGVESIIRTYGKPAIIECKGIMDAVKSGDRITLDGSRGLVQTASQAPAVR